MRKILLGMILLSVVFAAGCTIETKAPEAQTQADVDAFLRGENPELMELFDEQE